MSKGLFTLFFASLWIWSCRSEIKVAYQKKSNSKPVIQDCSAHPETTGCPQVSSIAISTDQTSINFGSTVSYNAVATYEDLSTKDVTDFVTWSVSPTTYASIVSTTPGTIQTSHPGTVTVTAVYSEKSSSKQLTITGSELTALFLLPDAKPYYSGVVHAMKAIGVYSDGSVADLTTSATWSSSNLTVATVDNSAKKGYVYILASGSTTLTATVGTISVTKTITASAATLSSISIFPNATLVPKSFQTKLTASANYSDGTVLDVTDAVTWSSANTAIATISNSAGSEGFASGVTQGTVTITATHLSQTDTVSLTVVNSSLATLTVAPNAFNLPVSIKKQLTATGTFSDGSVADISKLSTWTSSNSNATVSSSSSEFGNVLGNTAGSSTITATSGAVVGTSAATITSATLTSISVSPSNVSITPNSHIKLKATGTFFDASTIDLTNQVSWTSSNNSVAIVGNSNPTNGLVSGQVAGSTSIVATLSGITGSADITVDSAAAAELSNLIVTPKSVTLENGATQQFTATGIYSDGTTADLTGSSTWSGNNNPVATVNIATGLLTSVSNGAVTITVANGTISGNATAIVSNVIDNTVPTAAAVAASTSVTDTGFTLNWNAASDDTTAASDLEYFVCSGASAAAIDTASECLAATQELNWTVNTLTLAITGKTPLTTYYYNILARDISGNFAIYSGVTQATNDTTPVTPTNFTATTTSTSVLDLTWDNMAGDGSGYKIAYQSGASAPANCNLGTTTTAIANATSKSITGLTAGTQYSFIICTSNTSAVDSAPTSSISKYTKPAAPSISATVNSSSQITISWSAVTGDTGGYKIAYQSGASAPADCNSGTTATAAAAATSKVITGLTASTQYTFIACTVNSDSGQSAASSSATETTFASGSSTHKIFLSGLYDGNLGGLSGADSKCQTEAIAASLGGTWKAVLSDETTSAYSRLTISGQINNVSGTKIVDNKTDFFDGSFDTTVDKAADGTTIATDPYTWTGSTSGGIGNTGFTCSSWTTNASGSGSGAVTYDANAPLTGGSWSCAASVRLYCLDGQDI